MGSLPGELKELGVFPAIALKAHETPTLARDATPQQDSMLELCLKHESNRRLRRNGRVAVDDDQQADAMGRIKEGEKSSGVLVCGGICLSMIGVHCVLLCARSLLKKREVVYG